LTSFPSAKLSPTYGNNQSIAYAAGNTNKVVSCNETSFTILPTRALRGPPRY
jgi:hypothetical protein